MYFELFALGGLLMQLIYSLWQMLKWGVGVEWKLLKAVQCFYVDSN